MLFRSVEAGWEKAVETALGEQLQALVPKQLSSVESLLADWKYGHLSLIENNRGTIKPNKGSLSEMVKGPDVIYEWFNSIFIAEDLTSALRQREKLNSGQSSVTVDGILIGKNWIKTTQGENEGGFLLRKKELTELEKTIDLLEVDIEETAKLIEDTRLQINQLELQKEQYQVDVNMVHRKVSELNSNVSSKKHKIEQIQLRNVQINTESEQLQVQIEIDEVSVKKARGELEEAISILTELQQQKQDQQGQQQNLSATKVQDKASYVDASSSY